MKYNVKEFPKEEFLRLWDIVLIAREGVPIPRVTLYPTELYRVSNRLEDFSEWDRPAISNDDYVGMYYHDGQIWIKPGEPFREMQDTALHEIAHHEVPHECHGKTWRRVYGAAYALHLLECGYEWEVIRNRVHVYVVTPYRVFRKIENLTEQQRIIRNEVEGIIRHAKNRIPILTERGRRA